MQGTDLKPTEFSKKFTNINRSLEEEETARRAKSIGMQYLDLSTFPIDLNAMAMFTKEQAADAESIVFFKEGNDLRIGTVNPANEMLRRFVEQFKISRHTTQIYYVSRASLQQMLELYSKVAKPKEIESDDVRLASESDYKGALKNLEDEHQTFTTTKILELMLGAASQYKASDIHVEPEEHILKVRFRLDGVLVDMLHLPKQYQKPLISRIKIISKLKLNVDNIPQDGRFSYFAEDKPTDVRVSVLPSAYGEGVVMRILGTQAVSLKLENLGFTGRSYKVIHEEIQKPNGMIITTGPTGSGKTTTLYAFLNELNESGVKIITLEDPVEYKLEGINQTPIDSRAGMTFASGLRAILRQDPDVIMVGEIRDFETADVALQASLTGHMVLSTLHTNDAAGAIPRLLNMGVKPFVIAPGLNAIIAQRLVRRLCLDCKQETQLAPEMLEHIKKVLSEIPKNAEVETPKDLKFYKAPGCDKCNHLGYKGRVGIYEVIQKGEGLEKLIMNNAGTTEIKKYAVENGMVTMMQDGLLKALQGMTDVEEVFRVTQE